MLILAPACGKSTRRENSDFCASYADRLEACSIAYELPGDECRSATGTAAQVKRDRAHACLEQSCAEVRPCVEAELGALTAPDLNASRGGSDTGSSGQSCPMPMTCLDANTVRYCEGAQLIEVSCSAELERQGIVSLGCADTAAGQGCTVDGFLDPDCEAGTPPFAACSGLIEQDLLSVYVACYQDTSGASMPVSCHADYQTPTGFVDCSAARAACL